MRLLFAVILLCVASASHAQTIVDDEALRAFKSAVEIWQICPNGECRQSRVEASDGTVLIWVKDNGQWDATDADVRKWFRGLMMPDVPAMSCCGESDAYFADSFEVEGDHYVAIITDERDDASLGRPHIEPGTRVPVPNHKMKWDEGNPTGHGVIFIGSGLQVYCFVAPGGV